MRARAATWNLEAGGGTPDNFVDAVNFLAENPVDVLVVTEAKWRTRDNDEWDISEGDTTTRRLDYMANHMRTDGASMIGRLAFAPDTNCHIATFYNADLFTYHNWDVKSHGIWHVRSSMQLAAKGAPASEIIRFVGVHGHPFDGADRMSLAHLNRGYARKRALLLGDFNCVPESFGAIDFSKIHPSSHASNAVLDPLTGKIVRDERGLPVTDHRSVNMLLEAGFIDAAVYFKDKDERPTNDEETTAPKRIDLILSSPLLEENLVGYGQLGDPNPRQALQFSDHKGVWLDLNL